MEFKTKEEFLQEIEKEEKLCKEIYKEILQNRVKYEAEIKQLKKAKKRFDFENSKNFKNLKTSNKENVPKAEKALSPIKVFSSEESLPNIKDRQLSHKPLNTNQNYEKKHDMRIPLGSLKGLINFDGISSRKNPLDSLRNTSDRNEILSSFDSLQYSEDISFL